jgi:hypothetical protein
VSQPPVGRQNQPPILSQPAGELGAIVLFAGKAEPPLGGPREDLDYVKSGGPEPLGQGDAPAGKLDHRGQGRPEDPKSPADQLPVALAGDPEPAAVAVGPKAAAAGGQG